MKRMVLALAALILPQTAFASGFGTTGYVLTGAGFLGSGFGGLGGQTYGPIMSGLPTLDYHDGPNLLQIDVLGLISSITTKENFGIDGAYYRGIYKGEISGKLKGTVAPGGHIGLQMGPGEDDHFDLLVNLRIGAQALTDMGVGLYVVPGIGIHDALNDKIYLAMSGGIELSVWLTGGGGGD